MKQKWVYITEYRIGRNVRGVPMSDATWTQFQNEAVANLEQAAVAGNADESWVEIHHGTGTWTNEETGVTETEESAVVTLYSTAKEPENFALTACDKMDLLDAAIAGAEDLAQRFEQDAVALILGGHSNLIKAVAK